MSEVQRNPKNQEDEIDLRQLFRAVGEFFRGIGNNIVDTIIQIRRRSVEFKWLLVAVGVIGAASGGIYYMFSKPVYSSSMLLSSEYFNGRIVDNSIEKLNLLSKEEGRIGLSKALNIDKVVASNILEFEAMPFISEEDRVEIEVLKEKLNELQLEDAEIDKIIERIEIENKNTFQIIIRVNDSQTIQDIESSVVNYFRNNLYIKNRIVNKQDRLQEELADYQLEKRKLDSLKTAMIDVYSSISNKPEKGSDNLYIGEQYSADPVEVFLQSERVNRYIRATKEKIFLQDDFEIVDGLTVFRKPESAGLLKMIFFGFWFGIASAYALIILISINRYLNRVESERFL